MKTPFLKMEMAEPGRVRMEGSSWLSGEGGPRPGVSLRLKA